MTLFQRSTLAAGLADFRGIVVNARMSGSELMWALACVARSTGVFSVASSGDGDGQVNTSGNVFTTNSRDTNTAPSGYYFTPYGPNAPDIPRSIFNDLSHITISHASGDGQLSIQNVQNGTTQCFLRAKMASATFDNATATATQQPAAIGSDEGLMWGSGTDAAPVGDAVPIEGGLGQYRVIIGASDDPTYPFLYLVVYQQASNAPTFVLVWDTVVRGAAVEAVDNKRSVIGVWGNSINANMSPSFLSGAGAGWWGRFGTTAVVRRFRSSYPTRYSAGDLTGRFGRSAGRGAAPVFAPKISRFVADTAPYGIKGRLRNARIAMTRGGQLEAFDDADAGIRSAYFRCGDLLLPFDRFGATGAGGDLPRT